MYGDIVKAGETHHDVFDYGIPIPIQTINNEGIMYIMRHSYTYNRDLPMIEDIHPNKFISSKHLFLFFQF